MNCKAFGVSKSARGWVGALLLGCVSASSGSAAVVLSNLAETSDSTGTVTGSDLGAWSFTTGNTATTVNSVTLLLGPAISTVTEFVVRIRADNGSGLPGTFNHLGLDGSTTPNGASGGTQFVFTPHSSGITLAANTTYWLAIGAKPDTGSGSGSYTVMTTESDTFSTASGWTGSTTTRLSDDSGSSWMLFTTGIPMVAFDVSPVPEPSTYATAGGVLLLAAGVLRRRRNS